jgi:hypothetical protein
VAAIHPRDNGNDRMAYTLAKFAFDSQSRVRILEILGKDFVAA